MLNITSREIAETIKIKNSQRRPQRSVGKTGKNLTDAASHNLAQFKQNFITQVEAKNNRDFPKIRLKPLSETEIPTPTQTNYGAIDIDDDDDDHNNDEDVSVSEDDDEDSDNNLITEDISNDNTGSVVEPNKTNSEAEIDPKICEKAGSRNRHKKGQSEGKPFKCSYCDSRFKKDHRRLEHESIHTRSNPFPCKFCGKSFKVQQICTRHEINVHDPKKVARNEKKPFKCHICGNGFLSKDSRTRHMRGLHAGEKKWSCSFCGRKFFQNQTRLEHEVIHTKELPFKCGFCNKLFQRRTYCRTHQLQKHLELIQIDGAHSDEDEATPQHKFDIRIKCQNCPQTFAKVLDLRSHTERHHKLKGPKPKRSPKRKGKGSRKTRRKSQTPQSSSSDFSSSSPSTPQIACKLEYDYEIENENVDEKELEIGPAQVGQVEPQLEVSDIVLKFDNFETPVLLDD